MRRVTGFPLRREERTMRRVVTTLGIYPREKDNAAHTALPSPIQSLRKVVRTVVAVLSVSVSNVGNQAGILVGPELPVYYPFHCWMLGKEGYSRFGLFWV